MKQLKQCITLCLACTLLALPVSAQESYDMVYSAEGGTARVVSNLKWGLIDTDMQTIMSPKWDYLGDSVCGRRLLRSGTLFGFADEQGREVIAPTFAQALNFSQDLAAVKNSDGKWGYINTEGQLVIPYSFEEANLFSDGLALVKTDGLYGYINTEGSLAIAPMYREAYSFSEGLACVRVGDAYGYISASGDVTIAPQFELAFDFCEGAAVIKKGGYGLIDSAGETLIAPVWERLSPSVAGGLLQAEKGGRLCLIDTLGNPLTECTFTDLGTFTDGLCPAATEEGYGYLDKSYTFAISPSWDYAGDFSGGFAPVEANGNWGYIDTDGNIVTEEAYLSCAVLSEGFGVVCLQDGSWSLLRPHKFVSAYADGLTQNQLILRIGRNTMITPNGETVLGAAPILLNGQTLLPIRAVAEAIGGTVDWDGKERKITIGCDGHKVILRIGESAAFVDGRISILQTPPLIENGSTLIPLRFTMEALSCTVDWSADTREILITY